MPKEVRNPLLKNSVFSAASYKRLVAVLHAWHVSTLVPRRWMPNDETLVTTHPFHDTWAVRHGPNLQLSFCKRVRLQGEGGNWYQRVAGMV